jgi:hypothetical protein
MMYPIKINKEPQRVSVNSQVDLGYDGELTIADLLGHGVTESGSFSIQQEENSCRLTLYIYNSRLETQEEVDARVKKEEAYMERYKEYKAQLDAKKGL